MKELKISIRPTNRTEVLNKYMSEISKEPRLTSVEEVEVAKLSRQGDLGAREKLIKANLRFVISVAKQYEGLGTLTLVDLISEGNIGLVKAATRFDETRGFKFISYAVWWIRQSIINALTTSSFIRLPTNQLVLHNRIKKTQVKLEQALEREPTLEELSEVMLEIPRHELALQLELNKQLQSLDTFINEEETTLLDVLPNENSPTPFDKFDISDDSHNVSVAIASLSEKEKVVLRHYFGLFGEEPKTMRELGAMLQISPQGIKNIKDKSIRKIKSFLWVNSKVYKEYKRKQELSYRKPYF